MGHPEILNGTAFALEIAELSDEHGQSQLVPIVKATFDIAGAELWLAEQQRPVSYTGEHWGDPLTTSYKLEPETAFCKPNTDVTLIGSARFSGGTTQSEVRFQLGSLQQRVCVTGDRQWYRSATSVRASPPLALDTLPLTYERAYGGWDRTHADEAHHHCHEPNPVGRGYRARGARFQEGSLLPNLEAAGHRLEQYDGPCQTVGFGFIGHHWQPRRSLSGTYDEAWKRERAPLLPRDFDRRFFNAASPALIAPGRLRGDEPVSIQGVSDAPIGFRLPCVSPPVCQVRRRGAAGSTLTTELDTVIVDLDARQVVMLWRGCLPAPERLQGIREVRVSCASSPPLRSRGRLRLVSSSAP